MNEIRKILIDIFIIFGISFSILTCGCSMYNHNRIKSDILEQNIRLTSNQEYINLLNAGIKPEDVVKFGSIQDESGQPIGIRAAIDFSNVKGLKAYAKTFAEEPVSSTISLAIDAALAYYLTEGVKNLKNDHDTSEQQSVPNNINNIINFDSINSEGNVNVIQINNFGDVNKPTN